MGEEAERASEEAEDMYGYTGGRLMPKIIENGELVRKPKERVMKQIWTIEKDTRHGTSWRLTVGPAGIPGSVEVGGLSHEQAEKLGSAIEKVEEVAVYRAFKRVRDLLGIKQ